MTKQLSKPRVAAGNEPGDVAKQSVHLLVSNAGVTAAPLVPKLPRLVPTPSDVTTFSAPAASSKALTLALAFMMLTLLACALCVYRSGLALSHSMLEIICVGAALGFLTCLVLVSTKRWHGRFTLDGVEGVQKFHANPTIRVGSLAIVAALTCEWFLARRSATPLLRQSALLLEPILLAGIPAWVLGLLEDLTKKIGVWLRLSATMTSGLLLCWLTGLSLTHLNVWGADWLLGFWPVSVAFTAFAIGGLANAINIIDGFNGLATGTLMIAFFSIAVIAQKVGDLPLAGLCVLMQAAVLGFSVVNFPLGKIFLGDSGAYIGGVMLAWVAILLPVRNPGVSAWASLLACGYPVIEVLFSMARKHHREGHRPAQPDKVHLHMLLHSRFARRLIPSADNAIKNSLTSLFLWAYAAVPAFAATLWFSQTPLLMVAFLISAALYWIIYLRLTQFHWCLFPSTTRNVTALPLR